MVRVGGGWWLWQSLAVLDSPLTLFEVLKSV
jgi:hypothetical protein